MRGTKHTQRWLGRGLTLLVVAMFAAMFSACGVDGNFAYILAGEDDPVPPHLDAGDGASDALDETVDAALAEVSTDVDPDAFSADGGDGGLDPDASDSSGTDAMDVADAADVEDGGDVVLPPLDIVFPDVVELPDVIAQTDVVDAGSPLVDRPDIVFPDVVVLPDTVTLPDIVDAGTPVVDRPDVVAAPDVVALPDVVVLPDIVDAGTPTDHVDVVATVDRPDVIAAPDIVDVIAASDRPDVVTTPDIVDVHVAPDIIDAGSPVDDRPDVVAAPDRPDVVTTPDVVDVHVAPDIIDAGSFADVVDVPTMPDIVDVPPTPPTIEVWYTPSYNGQLVPSSGRTTEMAYGYWNSATSEYRWTNLVAPSAGEGYYRRITLPPPMPGQVRDGEIPLSVYGACGLGIARCPDNWAQHWRVYYNGRLYDASTINMDAGVAAIRIGDHFQCSRWNFPTGCVIFTIPN